MGSENMNIKSSSSLPEDLLIEILLCLPVKTLVRFKSVSKPWFALIDSSDFIHRHNNNNNNNSSSTSSSKLLDTFIFQSFHRKENSSSRFWNLCTISCDDHDQYYEDFGMAPCYRKPIINKSSSSQLENLRIKGYCNGVICLYDNKLRDVFLWNPAIHQFRFLPKSSYTTINNTSGVNRDFIAFGFDVETKDDYKVVLVTDDQPNLVQLYSLSTDSWRTTTLLEENVAVLPTRPWDKYGGYLNGSYYCSGKNFQKKTPEREILSFDFTKEIFKCLQLPEEINNMCHFPYSELGIVFLGGKLGIIHNLTHWNTYEFWVLNELGGSLGGAKGGESWTKLYTIGPYGRGLSIHHDTNRASAKMYRPIGISNNGEFILLVTSIGNHLSLLNRSTQVITELQQDGNQSFGNYITKAYVYRSSLVPVCSTTN